MIRNDVEIARWVGILIIDCRRDPLPMQRERANCRFDCARRAQRMRVITLGAAYGNAPGVIAEHVFYRRGFRAVVELGRTGVRVDVIDLLGCEFRIRKSFAHGTNGRFATRKWRSHVKRVVV